MSTIHLITKINALPIIVFDLSRNIGIHELSTSQTREKAVAGKTSGLISLGDTVTFKARHFGFYLHHQSRITAMDFPESFVDEMEQGHFKSFRHEHLYRYENGQTMMIDHLEYETPFGIFGKWFDKLILKKYLTGFLAKRNVFIKELAEKM